MSITKVQFDGNTLIELPSCSWCQIPPVVKDYLDNVSYSPDNSLASSVESYAAQTTSYKKSEPVGMAVAVETGKLTLTDEYNSANMTCDVSAGTAVLRNITPSAGGYYAEKVNGQIVKAGRLAPTGALRWIYVPSAGYGYLNGGHDANVRDLGGWDCGGGTVKYGKIIRGGQLDGLNGGESHLSNADKSTFVNLLRVKKEIDLRDYDRGQSTLGTEVTYEEYPVSMYGGAIANAAQQAILKNVMRSIFSSAVKNECVYIHCEMGNDRTGTVCFLIEALLGMSRSDIDKEYELSTFAHYASGTSKLRTASTWQGMLEQFENCSSGENYMLRAANYLERIGITIEEINAFREAMTDGTPETLTSTVNTYTVTNTLTHFSTDSTVEHVTKAQPFHEILTPESGCIAKTVTVKMSGVNITSTTAKTIIDASAEINADNHRVEISVPNVSGNLVITAAAEPAAAEYTNLFDSSAMREDTRITSGGALETNSSYNVSNAIPISNNADVVRIKGAGLNGSNAGQNRVVYLYNIASESGTKASYISNQANYSYDSENDVIIFTTKTDTTPFVGIRFSFPSSNDGSNIIVTVNEALT